MASKAWKGSYMESLVPPRKPLFDKFPVKGLALAGYGGKFGDGKYTFTWGTGAGNKEDKVEVKGPVELVARNKKKDNVWEVCCKSNNVLLKYQNKGKEEVDYVVGGEYKEGPFKINAKVHPYSLVTKAAAVFTSKAFSAAMDCKMDAYKAFNGDVGEAKYHLGAAFPTPFGLVSVLYAGKGFLATGSAIVSYFPPAKKVLGGSLTGGVEATVPLIPEKDYKKPPLPVDLACTFALDKSHEVKAKLSCKGVLELCAKKVFTPAMTLTVGCEVGNVTKIKETMLKEPVFGFKLAMKP